MDGRLQTVETFQGLNLNKNDANFIEKRIGNQWTLWDQTNNKIDEYPLENKYPNKSNYIRIECGEDVKRGSQDGKLVPFGFELPKTPKRFTVLSGAMAPLIEGAGGDIAGSQGNAATPEHVSFPTAIHFSGALGTTTNDAGANAIPSSYILSATRVPNVLRPFLCTRGHSSTGNSTTGNAFNFTASVRFNEMPVRLSASEDRTNFNWDTDRDIIYWGAKPTITRNEERISNDWCDMARAYPDGVDTYSRTVFSLDDVVVVTSSADSAIVGVAYHSGSRIGNMDYGASTYGFSYTAIGEIPDATAAYPDATQGATRSPFGTTTEGYAGGNWKTLIDTIKVNRFIVPLTGGYDGLNIREADPFNNSTTTLSGKNIKNSYAFNTISEAIEMIRDPDQLDYNIASIPGVNEKNLTKKLIEPDSN